MKRKKLKHLLHKAFISRLIGTSAIALLTAQQASAAEKIWNGGGANDSWLTPENWTGGVPASSLTTDTATFGTSSRYSIYLGTGDRQITGMTFNSATSYNLNLFDSDLTTPYTLNIGTGGITVSSGNHTITGAKPASTTPGTLRLGSTVGSSTFEMNIASGSTLTFDTKLRAGVSSNSYIKSGGGTLVLNANNGGGGNWNYINGNPFSVSEGTLRLAASGATGQSGNSFTVASGATLEVAAASAYNSGAGTLRLSGTGVGGVGALYASATSTIAYSSGSGAVLAADSRIGVASGQALTLNMPVSGGFALEKSGAGTLTLTNTNSYSGATDVSEGTLLINGSTSTGIVTVDSGATLGGTGMIGGVTTVNGTLAPGLSPGTLTFTNTLDLVGATIMEIDGTLGAGVAGGHDFVNLTGLGALGALSYGGTMTLDIGTAFGAGSYSWNLFDMASQSGSFTSITLADQYSGSLTNSGGLWSLDDGTNAWEFDQSNGVLGLTVIPEPGAALLGGLGMLALLRRRRA